MVYEWKIPGLYPVDANTAGNELERIYYKHGGLNPADIVDESRDGSAPLHPCFEWNDAAAAEKYREHQARKIVGAIVTVMDYNGQKDVVRAFAHVESTYHPLEIVVRQEDKMQELLETALRELNSFKHKYNTLSALEPVFDAIEAVSA